MVDFFAPYIHVDTLPQKFGGNFDGTFNFDEIWQHEMKIDDERLKRISHVVDVTGLYNLKQ